MCDCRPEDTVEDVLAWMIKNFEHSYKNNRAPFGVYLHAAWFLKGEHYLEAYGQWVSHRHLLFYSKRNWFFHSRFLDYLGTLPDVYIVSASRVIEYAKSPRAGRPFDKCQPIRKPTCVPKMCQLKKQSNGELRYMTICAASGPSPCPRVYPWLGNPFGKLIN